MPPKNTLKLTLTDIGLDGSGLAHHQKKLIFVPYTIPGEVVEAHIVDDSGKSARAEALKLLNASADRVTPRCKHFGPGRCGGCQWQHMNYEAQVALKTDIVIDQLIRVGGFKDPEVKLTLASSQEWGYSTETTFWPLPDGELAYRGTERGRLIPIEECHIIEPELLHLANELDFDVASVNEIRLHTATSGDPMVVLRTDDDVPPELEITFPASLNFLLKDKEPFNLLGETHVIQRIHDREFRVTTGVDFRSNLPQVERLVDVVLAYLNPGPEDLIFDLYGGVGVFAAFIASHAKLVTYVDSYPPAATDAEENLQDVENVDVIEGSVSGILQDLIDDPESDAYAAAVLDPPYTGLTDNAMKALGQLSLPRLVYVAQNPTSLANDVKQLVKRYGYRLAEVQPIDFMPQTAYIQCVALLTKE